MANSKTEVSISMKPMTLSPDLEMNSEPPCFPGYGSETSSIVSSSISKAASSSSGLNSWQSQAATIWHAFSPVRNRTLAAGKLQQSSLVSGLLAGFAMVALVEMNVPKEVPWGLNVLLTLLTTLQVCVHMLALLIATCIQPHLQAIDKLEDQAISYGLLTIGRSGPNNIAQLLRDNSASPNSSKGKKVIPTCDSVSYWIESAWTCSTALGSFLFMAQLATLVWVKFWDTERGHELGTLCMLVMSPFIIAFLVFTWRIYKRSNSFHREMKALEDCAKIV